MLTSQLHATYNEKGLFIGLEGFEQQSARVEFKAILQADAREFMMLINHFFQTPKFCYKGSQPTVKEYQKKRSRLSIYNRLLKLYLAPNLTIEMAFVKAMVFLEKKGLSIPQLQGRLTEFYHQFKAIVTKEVMEQKIVELETAIQKGKEAKEKVSFKVRCMKFLTLLIIKMAYRFHRLIMWLKQPNNTTSTHTPSKQA